MLAAAADSVGKDSVDKDRGRQAVAGWLGATPQPAGCGSSNVIDLSPLMTFPTIELPSRDLELAWPTAAVVPLAADPAALSRTPAAGKSGFLRSTPEESGLDVSV